MLSPSFAEGLSFASGLSQAFVAVVFLRFHQSRPQWGLNWLALSFALGALINTALPAIPLAQAVTPWQWAGRVASLIGGITCVAALIAGVRLYVGIRRPSPWAIVPFTYLLFALTLALRFNIDHPLAWLAGYVLNAGIFLYLGCLCRRTARTEPGVGYGIAATMLCLQPPMVAFAWFIGASPQELQHGSAIPFSLAGLGLMSASMGRLRAELKELNESLESRVAARTQELEAVILGLESFNRSVSHDLKGPLGGVHGLSRVIIANLERGETEAALRMVKAIHEATGELSELVNDLLALARTSKTVVRKQPTLLQHLVDQAVQWLNVSLGQEATQRIHCRGLQTSVPVDPALMRQVLVNLIGNAVKYSSHAPQPKVSVEAWPRTDGLQITVSDNGVGFDSNTQVDLFQPFKRLHDDSAFEGSGVGLTIVQRIVQGHGGRVWAESQPGQGARFHVWLPAQ